MSVSKTEAQLKLIYNGSNVFPVNNIDISAIDQKIYLQVFDTNGTLKYDSLSSDATIQLILNVDYTIGSINSNTGNFDVTWTSSKSLTIGDQIIIFRQGDELITDNFNNNNIVLVTQRNFDKVCRLIQDLKDGLGRTLSFSKIDSGIQVPDKNTRKDTIPYFDATTGNLTFTPKANFSLEWLNTIKDNLTSGSMFTWSIDKLQSMFTSKVDKVTGYALSKNDLTDFLKTSYDDAVTKAHTHSNKTILDSVTQNFNDIAFSGSYNDLSDTPTDVYTFTNNTQSGTPNAIILNTTSGKAPLTEIKDNSIIIFKATYNNTSACTVKIDNGTTYNLISTSGNLSNGNIATGNYYACIFDGTNFVVLNPTLINSGIQYTPYSVNSAKTDANGYASFISKVDNATISFDTNSGNTPIVICYPDCSVESNSSLPNITGISTNGTYFIIKEKGSNPYITTLQPVEQYTAPSTPASGQLWLDISVKPYAPKKWNGSTWVATQFVKLGEFTRASGIIASPINYALNGKNLTILVTSSPSTNTNYPINHCIGTNNKLIKLRKYITFTNGSTIEYGNTYENSNAWGAVFKFSNDCYSLVMTTGTQNYLPYPASYYQSALSGTLSGIYIDVERIF